MTRMGCFVGLGLLAVGGLLGDDWPQWRGLRRNGISAESGWSDRWPADGPRVAWKARLGLGYSSVVVGGGRVYSMGHGDGKDTVFCFDAATGKELWKHSYPAELGDKYFDGGTTGTPTLADGRLYTLSRWGDAFAFDAATGRVIWQQQVASGTGARIPDWGFGGAPLVLEDRVYLNVGEAGLALRRDTGETVWKSGTQEAGYSTPLPVRRGEVLWGLFSNGQSYRAVNLRDGSPVWSVRWVTEYGVNAPDPLVEGDQLWLSTGYGKGAAMFRLGAGEPEPVWKNKALRTQMNAAVLHGGHLYGVDGDTTEKASLKCLDASTGAEKWSQAGFGSGGLILADGRLIALSGSGELMVAPATPERFEPSARAQVLGGKCWTAPVLANGRVYCRNSRGDVVCLELPPR